MNIKFYEAMGHIDSGLIDAHFIKKEEIARKKRAKRRSLLLLSASSAAAMLAALCASASLLYLYIYGIPITPPAFDNADSFAPSSIPISYELFVTLILIALAALAPAAFIWYFGKKRIERKYKIF